MHPTLKEANSVEAADEVFAKAHVTKVCFVCTGNTCRSPMAAAIYNYLMQGRDTYAVSCGLYPISGQPISANAVSALKDRGIASVPGNQYEKHTATPANEESLILCDRIIGISEAHTLELIGHFPVLAPKIYSMPKAISDPYGHDIERYKACLREIEDGVRELFNIEN